MPFSSAALFTLSKMWKQPNCSVINENIIHTHTMECCSAIKKYDIRPSETMWMDLMLKE